MSEAKILQKYAGFFSWAIQRSDGSIRDYAHGNKNLILDSGLDLIGQNEVIKYIVVGSGTSTPVASDTVLESFVASTARFDSRSQTAQSSAPYYGESSLTLVFDIGEATGTLGEVGIGIGKNATDTLFSRDVIRDSSGNQTTITILSSEKLFVTYTLRQYPPASDSNFSLNVDGTTVNCTLRAANVTAVSDWTIKVEGGTGSEIQLNSGLNSGGLYNVGIEPIDSAPIGTRSTGTTADDTYVAGTFERTGSISRNTTDNDEDYKSLLFDYKSRNGTFQVEFDPIITKLLSQAITINVKKTWSRN